MTFRCPASCLNGKLPVILPDIVDPISMPMSDTSQKRAVRNYRSRLAERGMVRFEVLGRVADREIVRSFARRLAEDGPEAERLRAAIDREIGIEPPRKGSILEALRRSPLVDADIELVRPFEPGRKVDS